MFVECPECDWSITCDHHQHAWDLLAQHEATHSTRKNACYAETALTDRYRKRYLATTHK